MKVKRLLLAALAATSMVAVTACDGDVVQIGILKSINIAPLNSAEEGFIQALDDAGINYKLTLKDANADSSLVASSSLTLVGESDLVLGIATLAASGLLSARAIKGNDVPIFFTAVTDPVFSGLMDDDAAPDNNVTGTSDMNPVREQVELFTKLGLGIDKIGMIYCSTETNSVIQKDLAQAAADEFGLDFVFETFTTTDQVAAAMDTLIEAGIDGLYTPTDSTLVSAYSTVKAKADAANLPIIAGEEDCLELGAVATLSINYFDLGRITGVMAVEFLSGKSISELPVRRIEDMPLILHVDNAEGIGLTFPAELLAEADEVIDN
ncbi:MAG: ABC transporter substrate-binding protein [Erysipelotrichaceae bacterium]|jgi:putative ABC transport system substrate-binding protein|nr:ABC transporter substrate-binding protein [Erysipelotrichaceae bacterium]